jgi:hypothetical protein
MVLLTQLKLLINLARIDGSIAEREKNYIVNIAKANGFPESAVSTLLYESHDDMVPNNLTDDQKFDYIFSLVQLMKIDERLYQGEIKFCSALAKRLGYEPDVIVNLILSTENPLNENEIKEATQKHLKEN